MKDDLLSRHPHSVAFLQRGGAQLTEAKGAPYDCLILPWRKRITSLNVAGEQQDVGWEVKPASYWYSRN